MVFIVVGGLWKGGRVVCLDWNGLDGRKIVCLRTAILFMKHYSY